MVSLFKGYDAGYQGLIPPYIVLTQPQGRFSEAGFLGPQYKPFVTGGNPAAAQFVVEGIVAEGISFERQKARRDLLHNVNSLQAGHDRRSASRSPRSRAEKRAYDLILGDEGKVFDLTQENEEMRLRYGRTFFGQSCLLARRLVERGFPYITINYGGWDTHTNNFAGHAVETAGHGQGHVRRCWRICRARPAGQHHHLVERRIRPHAEDRLEAALGRRPAPFRPRLLRRRRRRRLQGRPGRRGLG